MFTSTIKQLVMAEINRRIKEGEQQYAEHVAAVDADLEAEIAAAKAYASIKKKDKASEIVKSIIG